MIPFGAATMQLDWPMAVYTQPDVKTCVTDEQLKGGPLGIAARKT
jgi:hypothetical protein